MKSKTLDNGALSDQKEKIHSEKMNFPLSSKVWASKQELVKKKCQCVGPQNYPTFSLDNVDDIWYVFFSFTNDNELSLYPLIQIKRSEDGDWPLPANIKETIAYAVNNEPKNIRVNASDGKMGSPEVIGYFSSPYLASNVIQRLSNEASQEGFTIYDYSDKRYLHTIDSKTDSIQKNETNFRPVQTEKKTFWDE